MLQTTIRQLSSWRPWKRWPWRPIRPHHTLIFFGQVADLLRPVAHHLVTAWGQKRLRYWAEAVNMLLHQAANFAETKGHYVYTIRYDNTVINVTVWSTALQIWRTLRTVRFSEPRDSKMPQSAPKLPSKAPSSQMRVSAVPDICVRLVSQYGSRHVSGSTLLRQPSVALTTSPTSVARQFITFKVIEQSGSDGIIRHAVVRPSVDAERWPQTSFRTRWSCAEEHWGLQATFTNHKNVSGTQWYVFENILITSCSFAYSLTKFSCQMNFRKTYYFLQGPFIIFHLQPFKGFHHAFFCNLASSRQHYQAMYVWILIMVHVLWSLW